MRKLSQAWASLCSSRIVCLVFIWRNFSIEKKVFRVRRFNIDRRTTRPSTFAQFLYENLAVICRSAMKISRNLFFLFCLREKCFDERKSKISSEFQFASNFAPVRIDDESKSESAKKTRNAKSVDSFSFWTETLSSRIGNSFGLVDPRKTDERTRTAPNSQMEFDFAFAKLQSRSERFGRAMRFRFTSGLFESKTRWENESNEILFLSSRKENSSLEVTSTPFTIEETGYAGFEMVKTRRKTISHRWIIDRELFLSANRNFFQTSERRVELYSKLWISSSAEER